MLSYKTLSLSCYRRQKLPKSSSVFIAISLGKYMSSQSRLYMLFGSVKIKESTEIVRNMYGDPAVYPLLNFPSVVYQFIPVLYPILNFTQHYP